MHHGHVLDVRVEAIVLARSIVTMAALESAFDTLCGPHKVEIIDTLNEEAEMCCIPEADICNVFWFISQAGYQFANSGKFDLSSNPFRSTPSSGQRRNLPHILRLLKVLNRRIQPRDIVG